MYVSEYFSDSDHAMPWQYENTDVWLYTAGSQLELSFAAQLQPHNRDKWLQIFNLVYMYM